MELPAGRVEAPTPRTDPAAPAPAQVFDRQFVFLSTGSSGAASDLDSLVVVPWSFRAVSGPEGVRHRQAARLSTGGEWESLADDTTTTPPSRAPWRIVPSPRVRIVVGPGDRIESLAFSEPSRSVETRMGDLLGEWERRDGVSIALHEATTSVAADSVTGVVLDLRRRWTEGSTAEPGDWLFVYGGTDLQLFLREMPAADGEEASSRYRGWARLAFRDLPQDGIIVEWTEARPFEPARRDVPLSWAFGEPDGRLSGELQSSGAYLEAEDAEGPILPVRGFFTVAGTVRIEGEAFEVVGIVRHIQR